MSTVCVNRGGKLIVVGGGGVGVGTERGTLTSRWGNSGCADCECDLGSGDLFCCG